MEFIDLIDQIDFENSDSSGGGDSEDKKELDQADTHEHGPKQH